MKVSDIMTLGTASVAPETTLAEAAKIMCDFKISALPVVADDNRPVAILTERDFFKQGSEALFKLSPSERVEWLNRETVIDAATPNPFTIERDAPVEQAARKMEELAVRRLLVVHRGKVVGLISRADLMRALTN
jgi:CBS domain-containing protein